MSLWLEREAGKFTKGKDKGKATAARMLVANSQAWREAYGEFPLPEAAVESGKTQEEPTRAELSPVVDLRLQTYEILSMVREPSPEEQEALKGRGIIFLPVDTRTYAQVVQGDPAHFWKDELTYATKRPALKDYALSVATQVGLKPSELAIPGSFNQPMNIQLGMIENGSQELQKELPDARLIMLPVTAYAQADHAYKDITHEVLFKNYFARGLDMLSEVLAAHAGRSAPSERFRVFGWLADYGIDHVGAVPAVVFVRK
jgi:hypothetical protein